MAFVTLVGGRKKWRGTRTLFWGPLVAQTLDFPVNGSFYYFHDLGLFLEPLCLTFYIGKLNQFLPFPAAHRKPMRIDEVASGAHFVFLQRVHLGDAGRQS